MGGVADKVVNLGGTEIVRVHLDPYFAALLANPFFPDPGATPKQIDGRRLKGHFSELADCRALARRKNERFRRRVIHDRLHSERVFFSVAPVAVRIEIAKLKPLLL